MKKIIFTCLIILTAANINILHSQENSYFIKNNSSLEILKPEYLSVFEDGYAVIGFKINKYDYDLDRLYGIISINTDINQKNEYFIPPIFNHVRIYKEGNVKLIDFELNNKWNRGIFFNNIKEEFKKITGEYPGDYYKHAIIGAKEIEEKKNFEEKFNSILENADIKDNLWINYWKEILINNKDLFNSKGEYEKSTSYQERVKAQIDLKQSSYREFFKIRSRIEYDLKIKKENERNLLISQSITKVDCRIIRINDYDADNESFDIMIEIGNNDKQILYKINVPIDQAKEFKSKFDIVRVFGYSLLNEDLYGNKIVNLVANLNNKTYTIGEQKDLSKYNASFANSSSVVTSKITSIPKLVSSVQYSDDNANNILDGDEKSTIKIIIRNDGEGLAQGINIKTQVDNSAAIEFKTDNYIGTIEPKSEKSVTIPVKALESLTSGTRNFKLLINEANGFNPSPIELLISTKELIKPTLKLSEVGIENTISKLPILKQSETSKVIFRIQNDSRADAKNLIFNIQIPNNILLLNGNKKIEISELKAGSIIDIPIDIAPNNLANSSEEFKLTYTGKYLNGTFSKNLPIESNAIASNKVVISGKEESSRTYNEVITTDLNIDIENNIPSSKINENAIAVVLGIEKYRNVGNVSFASRDASIVKEYFNKTLGIPIDNIYFKLNGEVTKGEMEKIFGGWLQNRVDENTSVYVYYAGHGAPSEDQNAYLIPNDGDPNYAEVTGYSLNKIYNQLEKLPTNKITVFIDACFSGQDREQKLLIKDARGLGIKTKPSTIPDKLNVFSASSNDQVSSGWPDKKHGLFTYFMLKGIQGSADNNNDKQISYEELSNYIKLNVERQAGFLDRKQNPQSKIVNLSTYFK
jgi:hypothetical protein